MAARPLIVMLYHNRIQTTMIALGALYNSLDPEDAFDFVLIDNGSTAEDRHVPRETWGRRIGDLWRGGGSYIPLVCGHNHGIPAALNMAMGHRSKGQDLIKIDNDCAIETHGWLDLVGELRRTMRDVAVWGPWFQRYYTHDGVEHLGVLSRDPVVEWVRPVFHQCAWHAGDFLDRVGYFDRLASFHWYGYGDHMIAHKARLLNRPTARAECWQARNLQTVPTLGTRERKHHVARVRPLFQERVRYWENGGDLYTEAAGYPRGGRRPR